MNWEMFRSDLKISKMIINRPRPSLRFDIPILPKAPRYQPASGPPPPRVDLQLVHDTDSFIVDKIILPFGPFTQPGDPRQRRAYYIIGWPDLPAARPVIDAVKILDYVSPYMLEEWEYHDALRREQERDEAAKEAREAAEAAAAATGKVVPAAEGLPKQKKKRGRKPKQARLMEIRAPTPQLDSEQEEMLARRKHGPSLSTPQKGRIAQLEAELDMLEDTEEQSMDEGLDPAAQIQRQLESNAVGMNEGNPKLDVNLAEADELGLLGASGAVSDGESSSRASSPQLAPLPSQQTVPKRASSVARGFAAASAPISSMPSSAKQQRQPTADPSRLTGANPRMGTSTTPIPLPTRLSFNSKSSSALPPARRSLANADPLVETRISTAQEQPFQSAFAPFTSGGVASIQSNSEKPLPAYNGNTGFTPANSFTPLGGHFPRPPKRPAEDFALEGHSAKTTQASTQVKKERRKKAPKIAEAPPEPAEDQGIAASVEQEYVVKRLEGHEVLDGVHYFKVRWEGDWPPDQNPTWEPQDNISADLVKKYLKRKAEREAEKSKHAPAKGRTSSGGFSSTGKSQEKQQRTLAHWARSYTSVSEAFEGKAELDATTSQGHSEVQNGGDGEDHDDQADELLVVDTSRVATHDKAAAERSKSLGAQLVAQFGRKTDF